MSKVPDGSACVNRVSPIGKPLAANSLPPLRVGIFEKGKLERVTTIPDPRVYYCQFWNDLHDPDLDCVARPLSPAPGEPGEHDRYAVVQMKPLRVAARMLRREEADAFAHRWSSWHGPTVIVCESIALPPEAEVLAAALVCEKVNGPIQAKRARLAKPARRRVKGGA